MKERIYLILTYDVTFKITEDADTVVVTDAIPFEALHQPFDAAGAVQQAVFTVYVQMNE